MAKREKATKNSIQQLSTNKETVSALQMSCFRLDALGRSHVDIAKTLGISRDTVAKHVAKIKGFIGIEILNDDFRAELNKIDTLAITSLVNNLKSGDVSMTIAYFKGTGRFVDKSEIDNIHTMSDSEIKDYEQRIIDNATDRFSPIIEDK